MSSKSPMSHWRTGVVVVTIMVTVLVGGCALFVPRDCETEKLPDIDPKTSQVLSSDS